MKLNPITGQLDMTGGDVFGPASALDNETVVFDGVTGKKVKAGSGLIITANLMQAADKAVLLSGTTGGTPTSGAGTRMMWIPAKKAFRAGRIYAGFPQPSDHWDDANVGDCSVAFGYNTKASGNYTSCFGYNGTASNTAALHFGYMGTASGLYSTHFGYQGIVSGVSSIHFGEQGVVASDCSMVGGRHMELSAAADNSFAFGYHISSVALTQPNTFYIFPGGTAGKVAIGTATPATSAIMDLTSVVGAFLPPRMTTAQKNALTAVNGMILYDATLNKFQGYENGAWANLI